MDKAEAREKERIKDDQRRQKKIEDAFRKMLRGYSTDWAPDTNWDDVRDKVLGNILCLIMGLDSMALHACKTVFCFSLCLNQHTRL